MALVLFLRPQDLYSSADNFFGGTVLLKDRVEDALEMFNRAYLGRDIINETAENTEFQLLHAQIAQEKHLPAGFKDLFTHPSLRKRTLIGFLCLFGSQAAGTQVINNYGPSLYAGLGYSTTNTLLIQSCWITTIVFGNIVNAAALDKFGRRQLLVLGFTGCTAALIGESVSVARYQTTGDHSAAVAAVFFLFFEVAV